jgi:hypothetical protein
VRVGDPAAYLGQWGLLPLVLNLTGGTPRPPLAAERVEQERVERE